MKVTGIIAEYDPFHNGHLYHIKSARRLTDADAVVAVMSGYFTQRGMPSFFDRNSRIRMAVEGGADLVIELPYIYACNSSHEFAHGAVGILNGLGCVDSLVFGAETDDIGTLEAAASASAEDSEMSLSIKEEMKKGISYPEALTCSVEKRYGASAASVLRMPNDLLGIEYIKALREFNSEIKPFTVGRCSARHGEAFTDERPHPGNVPNIASGTAVRRAVYAGGARAAEAFVPETSFEIISDRLSYSYDFSFAENWDMMKRNMFDLIKYRIITSDESELAGIYGISEGLENRLKKCISSASGIDELIDSVKSRRYTRARISRTLTHLLINLKMADFRKINGNFHARVLGFSSKGGRLLRMISESASIPVFSNLSRLDRNASQQSVDVLRYDMRASDIYAMLGGSGDAPRRERRFIPYKAENSNMTL